MITRYKRRVVILFIMIGIILCAAFVYANLYSETLRISKQYTGISYEENSEKDINIEFNISLEKKLFYDDLIDGTLSLNGKTYEISNHNAFFTGKGADGTYYGYDSGIRPFLTRLKDRINHAPYTVERIVINVSNHNRIYEVKLDVTRDFEMMAGTVVEDSGNYKFAAPAQNMDEVREVEALLFKP